MTNTNIYGYDEIPYFSNPSYWTQPDHLATLAAYFGFQAPPVVECRILELACGNGINLISIAQTLPSCSLMGIDMSKASIAEGQQIINALGMKNIMLSHMNIIDMPKDIGQFDYIIISGAYSWVSTQVQHEILEISKRHLSKRGLLYVHYLVYPAAYFRKIVSDIIRYHVRNIENPHECISSARNYLGQLLNIVPNGGHLQGRMIKKYLTELYNESDSDLYHQHLVTNVTPLYLSDFINQIDQHGLQYVADADLAKLQPGIFPSTAPAQFQSLDIDCVELEQLADLFNLNSTRGSLLCNKDITLNRSPCSEFIHRLYISSLARPELSNTDIFSNSVVKFQTFEGKLITISDPIYKTVLITLESYWPQAISFDALLEDIRNMLSRNYSITVEIMSLSNCLMHYYERGIVYLHQRPILLTASVSDHPVASPLARYIVANQNQFNRLRNYGGAAVSVSNLLCYSIGLDNISAQLLGYLDGEHDHVALTAIMEKLLLQEDMLAPVNSEISYQKLTFLLNLFAKQALLIA